MYYVDGRKYTGDMMNDKFEDQGIYIWTNGDRYEMRCSQMTCHCVL